MAKQSKELTAEDIIRGQTEEPTAAESTVAVAVQDPVAAALSTYDRWEASDRADEQARTDKAMAMYVEILKRRSSPQPGDGESLAAIMKDYGITPDDLRQHIDVIERADRMMARHADLSAARAAETAARQAKWAAEKRHEQETCRPGLGRSANGARAGRQVCAARS